MCVDMMEIEVVLSTGLTDEGTQTLRFPYEEGLTPATVAESLNLSCDSIGMISVDGRVVEWTEVIHPNQRVCFFPYLAGG
jgi:hypothetical protein